ncbi:DUF3244 domain-containing protein [Parabacteroides gordonii]|jgi:hypothetical protein|uniref:DUF3244 domain-containing protein n=1 Tax=Parabacteroides gordonii TaxID=574930 RepID=UPI00241FEA4C|nr:DUF3244 domain-containing protein [Parabacteroides gordonii]
MMKRFITILFITISFLLAPFVKANADKAGWNCEEDRSVSLFLSIEENSLHIHSDKQWENIGIQVVDPNGRTIYVDVIAIPAEQELTIPLSYLPEGNYQVTLTKDNQPVTWYLTK